VIIALCLMLGRSGSVEWRILALMFSAFASPASAGSVPRLASSLQHKPLHLAVFQTMALLKGKSSFEWRGARQNAVSAKAAPVSVGHSMLGGSVVRVTHLNSTHAVRAGPNTYQTAHAGTSSLWTGGGESLLGHSKCQKVIQPGGNTLRKHSQVTRTTNAEIQSLVPSGAGEEGGTSRQKEDEDVKELDFAQRTSRSMERSATIWKAGWCFPGQPPVTRLNDRTSAVKPPV